MFCNMAELRLSTGKSKDISIDDVKKIDNYDDAFETAAELNVDLVGLETVEEMIERMVMELEKSQPDFVNAKLKTCNLMKNVKRDDHIKRKNILELLIKTEAIFRKAGDRHSILEQSLQTEGLIQNLEKEFRVRQDSLKNGHCCFVVAGETSAGKSLFLNLLLGEDLLPSCLPPCTSVITKLCYDKKRHARIVYHDTDRIDDVFEEFKYEDLSHILNEENYDRREKTSDIKEVQIYLPANILESGLILVDTPGIGENEDMDKVIERFVDDNQVVGFVYIIKSDAGGGVDEDRLIKLMKIILQKEKSKSERNSMRFSPECAMFVCNIWDRVTEPEIVYNHIINRLSKIWPNFNEDRVIRFSAACAKRETELDEDYIITEFKLLLEILCKVYNKAMDDRVKMTYKWIQTILLRSVHHIKTLVRQLNLSENRLETEMKDANEKLTKLKNESVDTVNSARKYIDETSLEICKEFREYMKSPNVKIAIKQWIELELPDINILNEDGKEVRKDWSTLKGEIDEAIIDRLAKEFETWEEENGSISALEYYIITEIRGKLLGLSEHVEELEQQLHNGLATSSGSSDSIEFTRRRRSSSNYTNVHRKSVASTYFDKIRMKDDKFHLSTSAVNKIMKPFPSLFKKIMPGKNKMESYIENKVKYAKNRSEKLFKRFTELDQSDADPLKDVIDCFLEDAVDTLNKLVLQIPNSIKANQSLLDYVLECKRDATVSRHTYVDLMEELEKLKCLLAEYGAGDIFVDDFKPDELQVLDMENTGNRNSVPFKVSEFLINMSNSQITYKNKNNPRGLWTTHQKGLLKRETSEEPVTIKVYLPSSKMEKCYSEIAKLRLLQKDDSVAVFLGIQHSDSFLPALVYSGHLDSLKRHIKKDGDLDISMCLQDVASGLEHIHKNGMVHMELNTNTIMVTKDGCVQLTGCCLPRRAIIPENPEQHFCGDFIYLAPEVLRGDLYISSADIYAFGLLMLQLLMDKKPFSKQKKMSLDLFIHNVDPYNMMKLKETLSPLFASAQYAITKCLQLSECSRPNSSDLKTLLQSFKSGPCLESEQNIPFPSGRYNSEETKRN